jgi:hypothetical protein
MVYLAGDECLAPQTKLPVRVSILSIEALQLQSAIPVEHEVFCVVDGAGRAASEKPLDKVTIAD